MLLTSTVLPDGVSNMFMPLSKVHEKFMPPPSKVHAKVHANVHAKIIMTRMVINISYICSMGA